MFELQPAKPGKCECSGVHVRGAERPAVTRIGRVFSITICDECLEAGHYLPRDVVPFPDYKTIQRALDSGESAEIECSFSDETGMQLASAIVRLWTARGYEVTTTASREWVVCIVILPYEEVAS